MGVAALVVWVLTALGGGLMAARWLRDGGAQSAVPKPDTPLWGTRAEPRDTSAPSSADYTTQLTTADLAAARAAGADATAATDTAAGIASARAASAAATDTGIPIARATAAEPGVLEPGSAEPGVLDPLAATPNPRDPRGTRLTPALVLGHAALAAAGLVVWVAFLATDVRALGWLALVSLLVVVGVGEVMFLRWFGGRAGAEPTIESRFPVPLVFGHGIAGLTTVVLVLLATLGVGG